jgi:two-component system chemotaxis response regulator CheY
LGYEVEDVSDGAQALERYVLNRHDAVILDLLMHGMYGVEVLEKLKELNPALPVIIATADIQRTTRELVKAAGAVAMVNKPVVKEQLEEVLTIALAGGTVWN